MAKKELVLADIQLIMRPQELSARCNFLNYVWHEFGTVESIRAVAEAYRRWGPHSHSHIGRFHCYTDKKGPHGSRRYRVVLFHNLYKEEQVTPSEGTCGDITWIFHYR